MAVFGRLTVPVNGRATAVRTSKLCSCTTSKITALFTLPSSIIIIRPFVAAGNTLFFSLSSFASHSNKHSLFLPHVASIRVSYPTSPRMARLSSVLFDIFFWVSAFCLSPLILCYFILAGLRSCLISFLRLWKYPKPRDVSYPFDPDVEQGKGIWPKDAPTTKSRFGSPTVEDALEVKKMFSNLKFTKHWEYDDKGNLKSDSIPTDKENLKSDSTPTDKEHMKSGSVPADPVQRLPGKQAIQLPPEICDIILDLACYWPRSKTVVSRLMLVGNTTSTGEPSMWMDKERDWKSSTPGASKRSEPWRRVPSSTLGRTIDEDAPPPDDETPPNPHGVYLRTFPLGAEMQLILPSTSKATAVEKKPTPTPDGNSRWQRLTKMLEYGPWKTAIGTVVELDKRASEPASTGSSALTSTAPCKSKALAKSSRTLSREEAHSWALEIDELYPNIRPDMDHGSLEKREKKRNKRQWRSFYTMSRFHQWVIPIYQFYATTREEKIRCELEVESTPDKPFEQKNLLEPRLVDCTAVLGNGAAKRSAKVRKIVWTIWTKEMVYRSINDRRTHINPDSSPDLTWFEMFVEEPVAKSAADPQIVWKRKYPKGKENILVQRDLGHRIRVGESRLRIHRAVWDWCDWEDTEPNDDAEDEGEWRYQGIDPIDLQNIAPIPSHPFRHLNLKNYCNCPFGKKLYWGEGISPSRNSPVSSLLKSTQDETSSKSSSGSSSSSSSSGSSSSASSNSASSSSSSSSSSTGSSTNSSSNSLTASNSTPAPNTVLEERSRTGTLRKNGALGKLVRSLRMGDRLVLVARAGGGVGWNPTGQRWDVGVYRAEVEVHWAV